MPARFQEYCARVGRQHACANSTTGLAALTFVALSAISLNAQPAPLIDISKSVLLSWPDNIAEELIVVSAETVEGPWVPWREPVFKRHGGLSMAVPSVDSLTPKPET